MRGYKRAIPHPYVTVVPSAPRKLKPEEPHNFLTRKRMICAFGFHPEERVRPTTISRCVMTRT
jgi:hypothetical protein